MVNVNLIDPSSADCVDQYFAVFNGYRIDSTDSEIGPFSVNFCTSDIDVTLGTSRNGVDGPTATISRSLTNTRGMIVYIYIHII